MLYSFIKGTEKLTKPAVRSEVFPRLNSLGGGGIM
jgi:hypothetical protein